MTLPVSVHRVHDDKLSDHFVRPPTTDGAQVWVICQVVRWIARRCMKSSESF